MKRSAILGAVTLGATCAAVTLAQDDATPRHISALSQAGFLTTASGSPPEMTAVAGARFVELVPDSRREVCRILLEHLAQRHRGLYRLRIVDQQGGRVAACEL